jgi:hypothetical protein
MQDRRIEKRSLKRKGALEPAKDERVDPGANLPRYRHLKYGAVIRANAAGHPMPVEEEIDPDDDEFIGDPAGEPEE